MYTVSNILQLKKTFSVKYTQFDELKNPRPPMCLLGVFFSMEMDHMVIPLPQSLSRGLAAWKQAQRWDRHPWLLFLGLLAGSGCGASDCSPGHDLAVCGFEPRVGLCADWRLRAWSLLPILCLPLSLPLPVHALSLSVSKINKNVKKIKKKIISSKVLES